MQEKQSVFEFFIIHCCRLKILFNSLQFCVVFTQATDVNKDILQIKIKLFRQP